ncbi:helix-turn-helix domain-containing protein [Alicyclobacillus vulcanalis]|uniref:helix-turn-helix domain-containing protein n=1 Tax=Alicyclobacillus vulcanalis TaxID=252246 RepID=UPI0009713D4E
MNSVVERIEKLRASRGVMKRQISLVCGKNASWYSKILSGERRLTIDDLEKISEYFGVRPCYFFSSIEDE